jgi:Domain of unknown function (DUF5063)
MGNGRRWRRNLESNSHIPSEVARFAEVARRYCAWVEREAENLIDLNTTRCLLAELQLAALGLPDLDSGDHQKIHKPAPELKERVLQRVSAVPFRYYWNTFDPLKEKEEPVCGDLAEDLADIWLDLWEGLYLFDAGHRLEANFHWRVLYDSHWGQHVLDAQRAIYAFLTK